MTTTRLDPEQGAAGSAKPPRRRATRRGGQGPRQGVFERIAPYAYIAPFFLIFAVFGLFPMLFTF